MPRLLARARIFSKARAYSLHLRENNNGLNVSNLLKGDVKKTPERKKEEKIKIEKSKNMIFHKIISFLAINKLS